MILTSFIFEHISVYETRQLEVQLSQFGCEQARIGEAIVVAAIWFV